MNSPTGSRRTARSHDIVRLIHRNTLKYNRKPSDYLLVVLRKNTTLRAILYSVCNTVQFNQYYKVNAIVLKLQMQPEEGKLSFSRAF